jgi:hypothetical protein
MTMAERRAAEIDEWVIDRFRIDPDYRVLCAVKRRSYYIWEIKAPQMRRAVVWNRRDTPPPGTRGRRPHELNAGNIADERTVVVLAGLTKTKMDKGVHPDRAAERTVKQRMPYLGRMEQDLVIDRVLKVIRRLGYGRTKPQRTSRILRKNQP